MKLSFSRIAAFLVLIPAVAIAADTTVPDHEAVLDPSEERENRRLGGRKNCSHNYSTTTDYKICLSDNTSNCIKMTSTTNSELGTYDSSNSFKWNLVEVTANGGDRVRFTNKEHNHNLAAKDFDGNDGATAFKISQSSGPCSTSEKVKISYLDTSGQDNNDWLKKADGDLKWKPKSSQGSKFKLISV